MMDWSDRHCRMFHRHISKHTWLYTEMVTTGALVYGDVERHLRFNEEEHPVALQLGGSDPADLATSAKLGEKWGYDEINLNCGCPSERAEGRVWRLPDGRAATGGRLRESHARRGLDRRHGQAPHRHRRRAELRFRA
jgi:hypothetical protein